jgi:hypothetical protein
VLSVLKSVHSIVCWVLLICCCCPKSQKCEDERLLVLAIQGVIIGLNRVCSFNCVQKNALWRCIILTFELVTDGIINWLHGNDPISREIEWYCKLINRRHEVQCCFFLI